MAGIDNIREGMPVLPWLKGVWAMARMAANIRVGEGLLIEYSSGGPLITLGSVVAAAGKAAAAATQIKTFEITHVSSGNVESNDSNGSPTQWDYEVREMVKTAPGYGKWAGKDDKEDFTVTQDPPVGEGYSGAAYNWLEDSNANIANGVGFLNQSIFQNGVDHDGDDYPPGWAMQPLLLGTMHPGVILTVPTYVKSTQYIEECWLFPYTGEDGTCEET